jgi:hypothetical protein
VAIDHVLLSRCGATATITGSTHRHEAAIRGAKICAENITSIPALVVALIAPNGESITVALRVPLSGFGLLFQWAGSTDVPGRRRRRQATD